MEIVEGQEEGNKSNKSGSEDEVSSSLKGNKLVCMSNYYPQNTTSIKAECVNI
jgi:hypothetical protein